MSHDKINSIHFTDSTFRKCKVYSQKNTAKGNFGFQVRDEEGDLNNDNRIDKVIVEMDTVSETRPLRLQIFLSQPNSKNLKLVVSSTKIIESQYPIEKKGKHNGNQIPYFFIKNDILQMVTDIDNRKSRYIFRFKSGSFELINISRVIWDGRETTTETEINLLTGSKEVFDQDFRSKKKYKIREKTKPKPLPKIQNLTFSDLELY